MFFIISLLLLTSSSSSKKKTCGPTCNLNLLNRGKRNLQDSITKDKLFMIGKRERLSSYMGTSVRFQHNVPIQVQD